MNTKTAHKPYTNTYLDSEHSTSLRNLLAIILFTGMAQVLLIQIIPFYLYIGLVACAVYLLFGQNKVAKKLKGINSQQFAEETQQVEQKIRNRIRYLTSTDLKRRHSQAKLNDKPNNMTERNSVRIRNIIDFPK